MLLGPRLSLLEKRLLLSPPVPDEPAATAASSQRPASHDGSSHADSALEAPDLTNSGEDTAATLSGTAVALSCYVFAQA